MRVFTDIKPPKFVTESNRVSNFELQGRVCRLNRLMSSNFSARVDFKLILMFIRYMICGLHVKGGMSIRQSGYLSQWRKEEGNLWLGT